MEKDWRILQICRFFQIKGEADDDRREAEYIFYMACAVVGKVNVPFPNVRPDWQKIYEISAYHRIENIVAYAVEQLCLNKEYCEQIPDEVKKQFSKSKDYPELCGRRYKYHEYEKLNKTF